VPFKVPALLPDAAELPWLGDVELGGWLGQRVLNNERNRLAKVDLEPLLAGFRQRPGSHPWIGEHLGKWMHAVALAWAYTGDPELRTKLDDYPATTATDSRALQPGQTFTVQLPQPVTGVALRLVGKPASGDNRQQAFSSCAELQAFAQP
jgi:hypothetical protein